MYGHTVGSGLKRFQLFSVTIVMTTYILKWIIFDGALRIHWNRSRKHFMLTHTLPFSLRNTFLSCLTLYAHRNKSTAVKDWNSPTIQLPFFPFLSLLAFPTTAFLITGFICTWHFICSYVKNCRNLLLSNTIMVKYKFSLIFS